MLAVPRPLLAANLQPTFSGRAYVKVGVMVAGGRQKVALWVDTDIALGADAGDVDDGYALAWLLCQTDIVIAGLSVVSGNTDAATAGHCARALLAAAGRPDVGVHGPDTAPQALLRLPPTVDLLAIGPLRNLGEALTLSPDQRWRQVTVVGGLHRWLPRPWLAASDLNRRRHPDSWSQVLARQKVRQCPLDQARRLRGDPALLHRLAQHPGLGAHLAAHSQRWLRSAWLRHGMPSFPLWDLTAAMWALDRLPGARSINGRLVDFDVRAAQRRFLDDLLAPRVTETIPSAG